MAERAEAFADRFEAGAWGRVAGLWHDLGKYSQAFQDYLHASAVARDGDAHRDELSGRVDHSTAGAQHAAARFGPLGQLLAYVIAGHHADLPDTAGADSALEGRLKKKVEPVPAAPADLLGLAAPALPPLCWLKGSRRSFQVSVFVRMLFSALVDADFLATESFMSPERSADRPDPRSPLGLAAVLDDFLADLARSARDTPVNRLRARVLDACRQRAADPPGLFTLTVPTGGGKTLSSLAFALRHAELHRMSRVIYAIPFTSIIEQNAAVFRRALAGAGPDAVLEHHSNLDPRRESARNRLATENWDAPVVVTTNVQLFESLFAAKPSRCRKLHRIARSVIVLDEAQTLPVELLEPTLAMLDELCRNYGCTVVLCTATQPAVLHRPGFPIGLGADGRKPTELVEDVSALFDGLRRTRVEQADKLNDEELADRLAGHEQVLCIVNTRRQARELFTRLRQREVPGCLHLSAQMCPRHRSAVLRLIRRRLKQGQPCRLVSTQLIEAGVDVDFPVVYRAIAGLDAIAQAAGRCNREGARDTGPVYVFEPEASLPPFVRQPADATREVLPDHYADPLSPAAIEAYFGLHYWKQSDRWDAKGVMPCFAREGTLLRFRLAAEKYRLIEQEMRPVLIPYGRRGQALLARLHEADRIGQDPGRGFDRAAQRYIVGLHPHHHQSLVASGVVTPYFDRIYVLESLKPTYSRDLGLVIDQAAVDPEWLIE